MSEEIAIADIPIFKGANKDVFVTISNNQGIINLTGYTVILSVYEYIGKDPVITKTSVQITEINIIDPPNGLIKIQFVPLDTSSLSAIRYHFEVWVIDTIAKTYPVLGGYFWIQVVGPSTVKTIRMLLDEGGELGVRQLEEVVAPSTANSLYVSHGRIKDVQGVWLLTDTSHSGTNYFTGGGFEEMSRKVLLGTGLPNLITDVQVSYAWESGIASEAILHHLNTSRIWIIGLTNTDFNYNEASNQEEKELESAALSLAMILCILTINGANVAQMGYNFRVQELEIQTKLWGEGMIAEALFNQYMAELNRWLMVIGRYETAAFVSRSTRYNLVDQLSASGTRSITGTEGSER